MSHYLIVYYQHHCLRTHLVRLALLALRCRVQCVTVLRQRNSKVGEHEHAMIVS
jgi:hypothetical protein